MEQTSISGQKGKRDEERQSAHSRYNRELLRGCIETGAVRFFLDQTCVHIDKPLLLTGKGPRGKTTAMTRWTPVTGRKLLVNCGAEEKYRYWPEIAHLFIRQINEIDASAGFPSFSAKDAVFDRILKTWTEEDGRPKSEQGFFYVTDAERESFREGFVRWLGGLRLREKVCLVINDPELLAEDGPDLAWLPTAHSDSIHIICTSGSDRVRDSAEVLGWTLREFPLLAGTDASRFLDRCLEESGISLGDSGRSALLRSALLAWPGCIRSVVRVLKDCPEAEQSALCTRLGELGTPAELCSLIWERSLSALPEGTRRAAVTAFRVLACTTLGLRESELFEIISGITPVDPAEWTEVLRLMDRFRISAADRLRLEEPELRDLVLALPGELAPIHAALSRYFLPRITEEPERNACGIRRNAEYALAAIRHMQAAARWEALCGILCDRRVLRELRELHWEAVRSAWMHLRLDSDLNTEDRLKALVQEAEAGDLAPIRPQLLSLMGELEIRPAADTEAPSDFRDFRQPDRSRISASASEALDNYQKMAGTGAVSGLAARISEYLKHTLPEVTTYERCRFLRLKGDCEMQERRWAEVAQTAKEYRRAALCAASGYDCLHALQMSGACACYSEEYEAAETDLERAASLADRLGAMREYLSVQNLRAVCANRRGDFGLAAALLERCGNAWSRLGETRKAAAVRLSLCGLLSARGKTEEALELARGIYRDLRRCRTDEYAPLELSALEWIGRFRAEQGRFEEGEQACLLALDRAKNCPAGTPLHGVYRTLIDLYRDHRFYSRAIQTCETFADYLYQREDLPELAAVVREGGRLMRSAGYESRTESFEKKWREVLAGQPQDAAGAEAPDRGSGDEDETAGLLRALTAAEEAKDPALCAELSARLAIGAEERDPAAAVRYYLQARRFFALIGETDRALDCRSDAIRLLLPVWGSDPTARELAGELDEAAGRAAACWYALRMRELTGEQYCRVVSELLRPENRAEGLTEACLTDLSGDLSRRCEADQLVQCLTVMEKSRFAGVFREKMGRTLAAEAEARLPGLERNPAGKQAEEGIRQTQKAILLLEKLGAESAAGLAARLASVFSARDDKAYTLYYRRKAVELWTGAGREPKRSAEALRLAEALRHFGASEEAIRLLRAELKKPENPMVRTLRGSMAGTLAALLEETGDPAAPEKIPACFAIREAALAAAGEERELAAALLNRIRFGMKSGTSEAPALKETYDRARELVFRGRYREFYPVMQHLERIFEPGRSQSTEPKAEEKGPDPAAVEELGDFMRRLIRGQGEYQITGGPELVDGLLRTTCAWKEPAPHTDVSLLLMAPVDTGRELRCVFLLHPQPAGPEHMPELRDYVDWWNGQGGCRLRLDAEQELLSLAFVLDLEDPERVNRSFLRICRLWREDVKAASAILGGSAGLEAIQENKLAVLRSAEDE